MSETRDYRLKQRQDNKDKADQLEYEKMLHSILNKPGKDAYELQGDVFNRDLAWAENAPVKAKYDAITFSKKMYEATAGEPWGGNDAGLIEWSKGFRASNKFELNWFKENYKGSIPEGQDQEKYLRELWEDYEASMSSDDFETTGTDVLGEASTIPGLPEAAFASTIVHQPNKFINKVSGQVVGNRVSTSLIPDKQLNKIGKVLGQKKGDLFISDKIDNRFKPGIKRNFAHMLSRSGIPATATLVNSVFDYKDKTGSYPDKDWMIKELASAGIDAAAFGVPWTILSENMKAAEGHGWTRTGNTIKNLGKTLKPWIKGGGVLSALWPKDTGGGVVGYVDKDNNFYKEKYDMLPESLELSPIHGDEFVGRVVDGKYVTGGQ